MGAAPDCGGPVDIDDEDGVRLMGDSKCCPPGFRFHPTDEELVLYYLKRKICRRRFKLPMIGDVDVYKWEPWELPEKSVLRSGDKQWFFFSPRDRKYPNGSRSNRATKSGYWKATGKDRTISQNSGEVGNKKTLVYYQGRAPKGERTNWVMHEYTLDEQMLMRCNNVQDAFALYKLFRKSGPGPKNGEQYGAPFREEEWEDDAPDDRLRNQTNKEDSTTEQLHGDSVARAFDEEMNKLLNYDLEDILLQMSNELDVIPEHPECPLDALEANTEADIGSDIVGSPSYIESAFTEHTGAWCEHGSISTNFQIASSVPATYVQRVEMSEVTSLSGCSVQGQLTTDEEFLEIEDFHDPDSLAWSTDDISSINHLPEINEFYDPYDYFDAQMYLAEAMGPVDGITQTSHLDGFVDDETQNQVSHITAELWTHEQVFNVSTAGESNQFMTSSASSGMLYASDNQSDLGAVVTQGPTNNIASPSESWFRAAISAFLDSVPSSPAIASENALISRALERVTSFRAGQIRGAGDTSAATDNPAAPGRRHVGNKGGFLFISFLVGLGAIFWVLTIGATIKVIKGFWGRFISS